jgi:hypothetical protein
MLVVRKSEPARRRRSQDSIGSRYKTKQHQTSHREKYFRSDCKFDIRCFVREEKIRSYSLALIIVFAMQSLADVAREEAERRKQIDEQGIEVKVIERNGVPSSKGNLTTSTSPRSVPLQNDTPSDSRKNRTSLKSYRSALQKSDRTIRQDEARLESLRARLQSEKWALPKAGRISRNSAAADNQAKLQREIEELQVKIERAKQERLEIYQAGKRDGYLPGELDGKGTIP